MGTHWEGFIVTSRHSALKYKSGTWWGLPSDLHPTQSQAMWGCGLSQGTRLPMKAPTYSGQQWKRRDGEVQIEMQRYSEKQETSPTRELQVK